MLVAAGLIAAVAEGCSSGEAADNRTVSAPIDVGPCAPANIAGDVTRERYGASCICCHQTEFGVAGSVAHDAGVATVLVEDSEGKTAEMSPNPYDNFFRHRPLTPPLTATLIFEDGERRTMKSQAPHGSCNGCHGVDLVMPRVGVR